VKKWTGDIDKLIYTHLLLIGIPTIFYYCLRLGGWKLVGIHLGIATFYLFSALMIIWETTNSLFRRFAVNEQPYRAKGWDGIAQHVKSFLRIRGSRLPRPQQPVPRASFLVAAYLPNEQGIILDTLHHLLTKVNRPAGGLEVILAYNSPVELPIEADLKELADRYPELRLLRVEGSQSKAENLNAALEIVTGEIACVLDADHHPAPDCFTRAWRWLERDYDVVQGRNTIRNHGDNLFTQNVAIEFEMLYGISHPAKSFITDSSIFGGSNGYWRTEALKQIRFNPTMLTEDIDASLRTLLSGYRILHDRSIITTELAPIDFRAFWFQRKRWAQGWLEVSLKYQRRIWKSQKFTRGQKIYWTYLLYFCEIYSLIALQVIPLLLSLFLYQGTTASFASDYLPIYDQYLLLSTLVTLASGIYQTLATMKIAAQPYPKYYFLQHCVFIFFYTTLKNMIAIVGLYDHLRGNSSWVVTPRGVQQPQPIPTTAPALASGNSSIQSNDF
jgi:cellulose synthase/poly-beta-1,6-N-acetylglucosamine synthase-like glycosyltransferase